MSYSGSTFLPTWEVYSCKPVHKFHFEKVEENGFWTRDKVYYGENKPKLPDRASNSSFFSELENAGFSLTRAENTDDYSSALWIGYEGMGWETIDGEYTMTQRWVYAPIVSVSSDDRYIFKGSTYRAYYLFDHYDKGTFSKTINSNNREEYPEDGVKDGKWYVWKGIM